MDMSGEWNNVPSKPLIRRKLRDANRNVARSLVGTPNYIAPEVLLREGLLVIAINMKRNNR